MDMSETPLLHGGEAESPRLVAEDGDYVPARGFRAVRKVFWIETVKMWKIGAPIAFNILCQFSINSVTSIFVGHIGSLELSAVALSLSVISTFTFGLMVSTYRYYVVV